ncbi:hypothetical protein BDQ12DRAFT_747363 [Crucibulum laeve]|uniref:Uncharacterized protein n=1 Tax=Crucibulum laeve TaxID=68775 RepID=A0A5C3M0L7_9AGAR|nr:hypothetical protein BDQ12DRAFT_747363 [Crucibulum laeve]
MILNYLLFIIGNLPNCCSGSHNTPATCLSSGVAFYSYFKDNCPKAYAYPLHYSHAILISRPTTP